METQTIKEQARVLIDRLPDDATWEDVMHEIYVRQAIEDGLADSAAGKVKSVEEVRQRYGLPA
jgi:predicted transcriptional regulator